SDVLVQVRVTPVPSCMFPWRLMDTDVCGASVRDTITCLITCVTKGICLTHAKQEFVSLYLRQTRLTNMNHCRLYTHTYTSMKTCTHVHTGTHIQTRSEAHTSALQSHLTLT